MWIIFFFSNEYKMSNGIPLFGKPPPKPKQCYLDVTFHNGYFIIENEYHNHIISEFAWVQYAYIEKKTKRLFWNLHILLNIYWYIKTVKAIPLSPLEQIPIKREKTSDGLDSIANVFTDFLGPLSISADSRLFRQ